MKALLDTHSFLWFIAGNGRLSRKAQDVILDLDNELILSMASLWEMAIKTSLGKLEFTRPFNEFIPAQLVTHEITTLSVEWPHVNKVVTLPFHHRDPFDRLIIAQAMTENLPIITDDSFFRQYAVNIIW